MIEARDLTKVYVDSPAVDHVSFSVGEGDIVGFLGPNGAGKTTTLRMLTGFLPPTGGTAIIGTHDVWRNGKDARRILGYLPENVALYNEMRVHEYLHFRSDLEGVSGKSYANNLEYVVEKCLIQDVVTSPIGSLSKGFRQRVALAGTLIHRPQVLILDEPTVGLDPVQIIKIRSLIKELGKDHTILLSTHILPEVELVCNRVMIIDRGRILAQDTPEKLKRHLIGNPVLGITLKKPAEKAEAVLRDLPNVTKMTPGIEGEEEISFTIEAAPGHDLREILFSTAVDRGWTLLGLREESVSMEDIFLRLTTQEPVGEEREVEP
ncbi:MAG TPA: ATP-binding cassette domain-containing protein [Thermoanaerobaculia bacterium]|nr:ATP-binding cassette domain-containing protein [Thermoanaerobaculia bacterium]HUM29882.1 ATP-binding cassette domain-containing protein [Thermoanaerobaculia bacterium]HXK68251.1 ATP-binding cassette domain-containing protein [Thermoanaerobaculia bacterium]